MGTTLGFKTIKASYAEHRCSWCGESIRIGDTHEKWAWVDGGDIQTIRMHPECCKAQDESGDELFSLFVNERPVPASERKEGGET